jgi:hypothetical protein
MSTSFYNTLRKYKFLIINVSMKTLGKYSIGLGDRFGHQGGAQLKAIIAASAKGIEITPVWNKSNQEMSGLKLIR